MIINEELIAGGITPELLAKLIEKHSATLERCNKLYNYYKGKHNILHRLKTSEGAANNKIICNHAKYIVDMCVSYMVGNPVTYSASEEYDIEALKNAYLEQDIASLDSTLVKAMSIYGRAYELIYADEHSQPRSLKLNPQNAFVCYAQTAAENPLFGVYYYKHYDLDGYCKGAVCQVYTDTQIQTYKSNIDSWSGMNLDSVVPHYFGAVPLIEYRNNEERQGDFEQLISLIEEYKYLATLDYVTCETCQPLDGKVFKLSEAVEGVNYPTMHPRCRCTTTINMDFNSRRARNPLTGKNEIVDGDMTYNEWVKSLTPEQKQALEVSRKKDANKTADKLQFAKYKNRLGTKVTGRSFDKWQEMKYTDKEKWEDLKSFYRYKGNNPKSTQNDYDCVKELRELFPQGSFHIPAKEIDVSKLGFDDVHINQERVHNVSEQMAKEFINNAKASRTVWSGQYERYYSVEGVSFVNNEENLIRTAFRREQFNDEVNKIMEVLNKYGI